MLAMAVIHSLKFPSSGHQIFGWGVGVQPAPLRLLLDPPLGIYNLQCSTVRQQHEMHDCQWL